ASKKVLRVGGRLDHLGDSLARALGEARIDAADFAGTRAGGAAGSGSRVPALGTAPAPAADHIALAGIPIDVLGAGREEHVVEDVVIGIGPEAVVVILVRPERIVEEVVKGVGPEHRAEPADEAAAVKAAPLVEEVVAVVVVAVALAQRPAQRRKLGAGQVVAAGGLAHAVALLHTGDAIAVAGGRAFLPGLRVG